MARASSVEPTKLVADSATNGLHSGSLGSQGDDDVQPEFVGDVDRWRCPICSQVVQHAVQTFCGHRFCESCLESYLPADGTPARCPAKEEDCQMISREGHNYAKDFGARREVGNLLVLCLFYSYGCLANLRWKDLAKHVETCPEKRVSCPNKENGCQAEVKPGELDLHLDECQFIPKPCQYCEEVNSHKDGCPLKEVECTFTQFGCTFAGNVPALEKHHRDFMPQHLEMMTVYVASMDSESVTIKSQLQAVVSERDELSSKLQEVLVENRSMKETQRNLQNSPRKSFEDKLKYVESSLKRNLAKHDDRLTRLDEQYSKFDTDLSNHKRELSLLQNSDLLAKAGVTSDTGAQARPISENVEQLERQLGIFNLRMVEMDLRFQLLEASSYNGTLLWKITNYTKRKGDAIAGKTLSLYSQPFYTHRHGYKMCGRVYLNGDGMGKGTHISLFFTVMRGDYDALLDWPFRQKVTFMILDQEGGRNNLIDSFRPDPNSSSFKRPTSEMNIASGCPLFALQADVEGAGSRFIKDDTIFIKVIVDPLNIRHP